MANFEEQRRADHALALLAVLEERVSRERAKARPNKQVLLMLTWLDDEAQRAARTRGEPGMDGGQQP